MKKCQYKDCQENSVSLSNFCWGHIDDKNYYKDILVKYVKESNSIKDFCLSHARLENFDFIDTDCQQADLSFCDLAGANFSGANMKKCNLSHANLKNAYLDNADLQDAQLLGCNLESARLWHADLKGANLSEANLSFADLFNANLSLVKFWNVNIKGAKMLTMHNFLHKKGRFFHKYAIDESGAVSSADGYRNLKQYFIYTGRYDDASWASFEEKQMQMRQLLKEGNPSYLPSLVMALLCGYGEKPYRVILFSIAAIFSYAILYYVTGAINIIAQTGNAIKFWDCLYFSIVTFTTLGYGDISPKQIPFFQMITGAEAFSGAFMIGLFVFALTRKYSAR